MTSSTPCVLVVDDDEDLRETIAEVLRDVGYRVETAEDGHAALERMRDWQPCLVLLDLMMPQLDGWQVMTIMDGDPRLRTVPVCVVSAQAELAPVRANTVLPKPVKRDVLLKTIETYCGPPCMTDR